MDPVQDSSSVGTAWILFLETDGTVKSEQKISELAGGFEGTLADADNFGFSLAYLGSPGGAADLAVGAYRDDDNGTDRGALWNLELERAASAVPALGGPALLALIAGIAAAGSRFAGRRRG